MSHSYLSNNSVLICRADQIPVVFSSNFSQLLVSSLSKEDAVLHPVAKKSMARIKAVFGQTKDSEVKAALAVVLQREPGSALAQIARKSSEVVKVSLTSIQVTKKFNHFFSRKWNLLERISNLFIRCLWQGQSSNKIILPNLTAYQGIILQSQLGCVYPVSLILIKKFKFRPFNFATW